MIQHPDDTTPASESYMHAMQYAAQGRALLVALVSPTGECLSANNHCLDTLGLDWKELSSRNILETFTPFLAPGELGRIRSRLRKGGSYSMRLRWPRSDGQVVHLETWVLPLSNQHQRIQTIMLLAADVTARLERERKRVTRYRHMAEVVDRTAHAVAITDAEFKTLYVNASFTTMFGYARRHLLGKSPTVVFGADEKYIRSKIRKGIFSALSLVLEETAYGSLGQKMWVSLSVNAFIDQHERRRRVVFAFTDITSAKFYEILQDTALAGMARDFSVPEILTLVRREVENLIPGVRTLAFSVDGQGTLRWLIPSREAHDHDAISRGALLRDTPLKTVLQKQSALLVQDIRASAYPRDIKDIYAAMKVEAVFATPIYSSKKKLLGLVAFFYEQTTERNDMHARVADIMARICSLVMEWGESRTALRMFTHYNPLTGLANLHLLSVLTEQEMLARQIGNRAGASVAALCINIERFRRIGKTWGIEAANGALKAVAQRLSDAKGPNDLLAHSFEDEFVLISMDCDEARAWETGRRIQAALALPLQINNTEVILSANIGVGMRRADQALDEGPSRIIEEARSALFRMKRGERAQILFFSETPEPFSEEDISLESRLVQAIEQGKLRLFYQPQVSLKDGAIHGVEALCRWEEADLGFISPTKFIPLAEENGLIALLGDWALREACRQLSDWRRRNVPVPVVAVNLSALNFRDAELPARILSYLEEYSLSPRELMLELTETVLLDNDPITIQTLRKARDLGLALSLDDFGTGYSSLSYLQNLPISEMKLDRSFVQDLHESEISQRLSKAIIRVGESLGLLVLAEGVENKLQLDVLKKHHYHVVQGYFLAEPLPPGALESWLAAWDPALVVN